MMQTEKGEAAYTASPSFDSISNPITEMRSRNTNISPSAQRVKRRASERLRELMPTPKQTRGGLPAYVAEIHLASGWERVFNHDGATYVFGNGQPLTLSRHDVETLQSAGSLRFVEREPLQLLGHVTKRGEPNVWFFEGASGFHAMILEQRGAVICMETVADDPTDAIRSCLDRFNHIKRMRRINAD